MSMTKKEALATVFACAKEYKNNLAGRSLLFVCTDKHKNTYCVEVTFDASNFQHMTGFVTTFSALEFFNRCIDQRLRESDFEFAPDGTTELKMLVLPGLVQKNISANMIGDYDMSHPKLYTEKLAGGIKACIGFVKNGGTGRYVPNTVLNGDMRNRVKKVDRIIVTYRKNQSEKQYSEIVYLAKKIEWDKVIFPVEYQYLSLTKNSPWS